MGVRRVLRPHRLRVKNAGELGDCAELLKFMYKAMHQLDVVVETSCGYMDLEFSSPEGSLFWSFLNTLFHSVGLKGDGEIALLVFRCIGACVAFSWVQLGLMDRLPWQKFMMHAWFLRRDWWLSVNPRILSLAMFGLCKSCYFSIYHFTKPAWSPLQVTWRCSGGQPCTWARCMWLSDATHCILINIFFATTSASQHYCYDYLA